MIVVSQQDVFDQIEITSRRSLIADKLTTSPTKAGFKTDSVISVHANVILYIFT